MCKKKYGIYVPLLKSKEGGADGWSARKMVKFRDFFDFVKTFEKNPGF